MGCFSYMCKECDTPVNSDSFSGERCIIFLLKNGKVIEQMEGQYDSYGCVFDENMKSIEWKHADWNTLCDMHFSDDKSTGFAYVHQACYKGKPPTTISKSDPEQGWGDYRKEFL